MPKKKQLSDQAGIQSGEPDHKGKLGTFAGVFTPSILTILGIILFLRLGYVTGSAGVGKALLIVAVANVITVLTSQSLAAIATNLKVKGGGDYYLISRTLGVEFGGAIGIVLYLAQSVSVAFYCIGFGEALSALLGQDFVLSPQIIATLAILAIFALAWLGADWATRFQYVVMALLLAALFSFFFGGIPQWQPQTFLDNWRPHTETVQFWVLFGIFFPAVTGFTQGVSMSGDLKDPGKSLPMGTFLAVGLSIVVYFAVVIIFAGVLPNKVMTEDLQAIKQVSKYDFLIDAGVIAATLSSAMASFLGGPRILQSLSADRIFPLLNPFTKGSGVTNNPRRAVLFTCLIALITVSLGQLDLVARIVSMFFLISYGLLNYATWYEAKSESPSFRPRFKWFNEYLSLLGCLVCGAIILALDLEYGLIALAVLIALHQYIKRQGGPPRWSDSGRSHSLQVIRKELFKSHAEPQHDRDWRPLILAFTKDEQRRSLLLHFSDWIAGNSGLVTAIKMVEGLEPEITKEKDVAQKELQDHVRRLDLNIFPLTVKTDDITQGLQTLLQTYGIGPIKGNTFLCNWYGETLTSFPGLTAMKFGHNLRLAFRSRYNLVVFHGDPLRTETLLDQEKKQRVIDIWWNDDASSRLMLLLGYLMTRHQLWKEASLRVLTTTKTEGFTQTVEQLTNQLEDARITAEPVLVADTRHTSVVEHSANSDLVFLPFRIKRSMLTDPHGYSPERVLSRLPPVALVMAAENIDLDAEPEEGHAGELADALDSLRRAEKKLKKATVLKEKDALHLLNLEKKRDQLTEGHDSNKETLEKLNSEIEEARGLSEKSFRKRAKEQAKHDSALELVQQLGGHGNQGEGEGA